MARLITAALLAAAQGPIAGAGEPVTSLKSSPEVNTGESPASVERPQKPLSSVGPRAQGAETAQPAPALLAAWVYAVDLDLARSIAFSLDAQPQQVDALWPWVLAVLGCVANQTACCADVDEAMQACFTHCSTACQGSNDPDCLADCNWCCDDVAGWDCLACEFTCGANGPEPEGYENCWQNISPPLPPDPPYSLPGQSPW